MPLLCIAVTTAAGQSTPYRLSLEISDTTHTDTLHIGAHPNATSGYDIGLDSPHSGSPDSAFRTSIITQDGTRLTTDFRDTTDTPKSYLIRYHRDPTSGPLRLTWDPSILPEQALFILSRKSPDGYQLLGISMNDRNAFNLTNSPLMPREDHFRINVYPDPQYDNFSMPHSLSDTSLYVGEASLQYAIDSLFTSIDNSRLYISSTSSNSEIAADSIRNDTLSIYPGRPGNASVIVTATDKQNRFLRDTVYITVYRTLRLDTTYSNFELHPGETKTLERFPEAATGGVPPIRYSVISPGESMSATTTDSTIKLEAQHVDSVGVSFRVEDARGSIATDTFQVTIIPRNQPPPPSILTAPTADTLIHLQGKPDDRLLTSWTSVQDPDSQQVIYRWQFTLNKTFDPDRSFTTPYYSNTRAYLTYGLLDSLLSSRNVEQGDTVQVRHRIISSDSLDTKVGPSKTFKLIYGHVAPYVKAQFIHNAPGRDTLDIYINQRFHTIADSLSFRDATAYHEVPTGQQIEIYITGSGENVPKRPFTTVELSPDSPYLFLINGRSKDETILHYISRRMTHTERSKETALSVAHGLPDMLGNTVFQLKRYSDSRLIGTFGSEMQYGDISSYMPVNSDRIIFESGDHPRQFVFKLQGLEGQAATIVTTPRSDTATANSGFSFYHASIYDTSGQRHTPLKSKAIAPEQEREEAPQEVKLYSNYPNPFNPSTEISFAIPRPMPVSLKIFNILGKEVETLVDKKLEAGKHTYQFEAQDLTSGIYIYRLHTPQTSQTRKMMLVR